MRGDLVYQRVTDGRVIEVLRDELGRNFVALMSRWRVWGTTLPYGYRRGRSRSANEGRTEAVLEVCSFRELAPQIFNR